MIVLRFGAIIGSALIIIPFLIDLIGLVVLTILIRALTEHERPSAMVLAKRNFVR